MLVLAEEKDETLSFVGTHSIPVYKNDLKLTLALNPVHG